MEISIDNVHFTTNSRKNINKRNLEIVMGLFRHLFNVVAAQSIKVD